YCDLLLNADEAFTYEFSSIPFDFSVLPPQFLTVNAHFGSALDPDTFDPEADDAVRVEVFESSKKDPAFFYGLIRYKTGEGWIIQSNPQHWQDLHGALRITVVSGSVVLRSIQVGVVTPRSGGGYNAYN